MKTFITRLAIALLVLFALVTLFMSSSVIFDLFGIREKEGNYVLFVVVANFSCGLLYLTAAYGWWNDRAWAPWLLLTALGILIVTFIALQAHISSGGIYEEKTVGAMWFRMGVTAGLALVAWVGKRPGARGQGSGIRG